jgi:transposase
LLEIAQVTPANVQDRDAAIPLLKAVHAEFPTVRKGWADLGYRGEALRQATGELGIDLEIVRRRDGGRQTTWAPVDAPPRIVPLFAVVPRRWVVERTFGWLGRSRRLARDYEYLVDVSVATIYAVMVRLMLRRLARTAARPS